MNIAYNVNKEEDIKSEIQIKKKLDSKHELECRIHTS